MFGLLVKYIKAAARTIACEIIRLRESLPGIEYVLKETDAGRLGSRSNGLACVRPTDNKHANKTRVVETYDIDWLSARQMTTLATSSPGWSGGPYCTD